MNQEELEQIRKIVREEVRATIADAFRMFLIEPLKIALEKKEEKEAEP